MAPARKFDGTNICRYLTQMADDSSKHRDRYDVSGNVEAEFVDPSQLVLVNKRNVVDLNELQLLEEEFLAKAYETLVSEVCVDTTITCDLIHPFREGNARTIKLVTDLLASQTGRPLLAYDQTECGRDLYIAAASQAFGRNFAPMEAVIRRALSTAKGAPPTPP